MVSKKVKDGRISPNKHGVSGPRIGGTCSHEIVTKMIPWHLFFPYRIFDGISTLEIHLSERDGQGREGECGG